MTRLPTQLFVDLLRRSAQAAGGFVTILARGDAHGGMILIQCRDRAAEGPLLERGFQGQWQAVGPGVDAADTAKAEYLERRRRIDPDLWLIELDIAQAPQFVANLDSNA